MKDILLFFLKLGSIFLFCALILEVNAQVVSTFAGSGQYADNDGAGMDVGFNYPADVTTDAAGNIYVADRGNNKIRKITPEGVVSTFAGSGVYGSDNGTGTNAGFSEPNGVATDTEGNVYVADWMNHKIRKITPAGIVSTLAGSGFFGSNEGPGTAASFYYPSGVATDTTGNVYVSDTYNHKIRKIIPEGIVSTFAGSGSRGSDDGRSTDASFFNPTGIATDAAGNIYVADRGNNKIRKITPEGIVSTLAGSGIGGSDDGTGTAASFSNPTGLAIGAEGNIYVADYFNHIIRKITPEGIVSTLAGSGIEGSDDGTGISASFKYPYGVTTDALGNVYVADRMNNKIRKISTIITGTSPKTSANSISIYPNPANTILTISNSTDKMYYEITDITGRVLQSSRLENNCINIDKLPAGHYIIRIQSNVYNHSTSFVKE